jgi:hypothetical protein
VLSTTVRQTLAPSSVRKCAVPRRRCARSDSVAYDPPADVFVWLTRLVASSWFRTIQARGSIPKRSERHIGESTHIGDGFTPTLGEMEEWRSGGYP